MASGRPAGFSDEEYDSDDFGPYDDYQEQTDQVEQKPVSCGDPWCVAAAAQPNTDTDSFKVFDIIKFRSCIEVGDACTIRQFFASAEGAKCKNKYLKHGFTTFTGSRPAFLAAEFGHVDVLRLLIEEGASIDPDSRDGVSLLMTICGSSKAGKVDHENNLLKCILLLVDHWKAQNKGVKAMVNETQSQNFTALMLAAKQGFTKIVSTLIQLGANLDASDTQRWTAVCFAIDKGQGHVARILLEAGADPDVITVDGQALVDLVPATKSFLLSIIESFSLRKKALVCHQVSRMKEVDGYRKFSELENVLLGIDATEYLEIFEHHKLSLEHFLCLGEEDLEKIGVDKVGVRKKMLEAICEIHKRDWDKSSIPKIQPKDRRKGIYFTCPDGVMMVANMNRHLTFLNANLKFIKKNITEHPEILHLGQDVANVKTLLNHVKSSQQQLNATASSLKKLNKTLSSFARDPNYAPSDQIKDTKYSTLSKLCLIFSVSVLPFVAFKVIFRKA